MIVRLCQKRWRDALAEAAALNKKVPDDVMVWGYMADADVALGNVEEAKDAVQMMLDLRRVNPQGMLRAAALRELYGFNDAALEWWNSTLRLTSATDLEERAWLLTRIAHVHRVVGRYEASAGAIKQALDLLPNYPWALTELGRTQMDQKNYSEALSTFAARLKTAPSPGALFELGLAQDAAGKKPEAQSTFVDFEKQALAVVDAPENANLELIRYYAGPGQKPSEARRIAELTLKTRKDAETLHAYAQALAAGGNVKAAGEQMALALKPDVKNPAWLLEAGRIARKSGEPAAAHKYFQQALEAAPASPLSSELIQELTRN
jgi:tetratricopeptide (TPR) repeat protein